MNDIMPMIGARFYTQLDAAQMRNDVIEEDLAKVESSYCVNWYKVQHSLSWLAGTAMLLFTVDISLVSSILVIIVSKILVLFHVSILNNS